MKVAPRHRWDVSPAEAIRIQQELRRHLRLEGHPGPMETVGGVDVSYDKQRGVLYAAVVVMRLADLEVVETATAVGEATFPYVPGLLSFRESPMVLQALAKITQRLDCLLCDGQGIAHPRRFGIACHLGLMVNLPAVGCAKSLLVGEYREPGSQRGDFTPLYDRGEQVGIILRTKDGVEPVYVSPGYLVSFEQAREIVLTTHGGHRLPEPIRQAHLLVNQLRQSRGRDLQPSLWASS